MDRAHVLYLINNLSNGGTQRVISELATRLDARKFRVSLAALAVTPPERIDRALIRRLEEGRIPIHSLDRPGTRKTLEPVLQIYRLLRSEQVDIIHTGVFQPDFYGQVAGYLARVPVRVRTFHVAQQWPPSSRWIGRICEPFLKHLATHNTAVSSACQLAVAREIGLPPERILRIPNAVAIEPPQGDRQAIRQALGFDDRPVLAIIGRLAKEKRHRTLFLAAKALAHHPRDPLFVVIGDGALRPELESLVDELGIRHSVRFLGMRSDMADLYQAIDVVINASSMEGLPMTLLESLAAKRAVVASDISANSEVVRHEETGLLFALDSVPALTQALARVLDTPELAERLARNGHDLVRREHSLEDMVQRYQDLYLSGLSQARGLELAREG